MKIIYVLLIEMSLKITLQIDSFENTHYKSIDSGTYAFKSQLLIICYKKNGEKIQHNVLNIENGDSITKIVNIPETKIKKTDELSSMKIVVYVLLFKSDSDSISSNNITKLKKQVDSQFSNIESDISLINNIQSIGFDKNFLSFYKVRNALYVVIPSRTSSGDPNNQRGKNLPYNNDEYINDLSVAIPFPDNIDVVYKAKYNLTPIPDDSRTPWLKTYKIPREKIVNDDISTNFDNLPNVIFADESDLTALNNIDVRLTPYFIGFNVSNQCGLGSSGSRNGESLVEISIPIWVTIEIGSPNLLAAYQKILPGEGFHFLLNSRDINLITPRAKPRYKDNKISVETIVFSKFLPKDPDQCCTKSDGNPYCGEQTTCKSIFDAYNQSTELQDKGVCVFNSNNEAEYCLTPQDNFRGHCDPKVPDQMAQLNDFGMCSSKKPGGDHPLCCFTESSTKRPGDYNWQIGGGRILIHYVDPMIGVDPANVVQMNGENIRTHTQPIEVDSNNKPIPNQDNVPKLGYINGAGVRDSYCQLLEFTVDYFLNTPGKYIPMFSYDASSVDSTSFPTYMKAIGRNNKASGCEKDQCCLQYIGKPDKKLKLLANECPTGKFNPIKLCDLTDTDNCIDSVGQCISLGKYCGLDANSPEMKIYATDSSGNQISDYDKNPLNDPRCHIYDNFENEMGPGFKVALDQYLGLDTGKLDNDGNVVDSTGNIKMSKQEKDAEKLRFINRNIYGCEWASDENFNTNRCNKIRINDKKCRALNWGVFPSYAAKHESDLYQHGKILDPFECSLGSCPTCGVTVGGEPKSIIEKNPLDEDITKKGECSYNPSLNNTENTIRKQELDDLVNKYKKDPTNSGLINDIKTKYRLIETLGSKTIPKNKLGENVVDSGVACCQENISPFCYGIQANNTTDELKSNPMTYFYKNDIAGMSTSDFQNAKNGEKASDFPLYNAYSKYVHENAQNVYGYSLDDLIGLSQCDSWALNVVAGPRCVAIASASGKTCKLPSDTSGNKPIDDVKKNELWTRIEDIFKTYDPKEHDEPTPSQSNISFNCSGSDCCDKQNGYNTWKELCNIPFARKNNGDELYGCYPNSDLEKNWRCIEEKERCPQNMQVCKWGTLIK